MYRLLIICRYKPPSGPPPGYHQSQQYQPPPGPPPGHGQNHQYQPPPGPPPGQYQQQYQPPPGPPPGHYARPPGPPPPLHSKPTSEKPPADEPPPYHDWTIIPDTALLPPPPSIAYDVSPASNASEEDGERAYDWCNRNPLWPPQPVHPTSLAALRAGHMTLLKPAEYVGDLRPRTDGRPGTWIVRSWGDGRDVSLITTLPLYSALNDSPARTGVAKTVYFEVRMDAMGRGGGGGHYGEEADASMSVGFVAPPYPTWRQPGWQRASLAVHGDDGRRFVNDPFGGTDFTTMFKPGDVVGIGMTFERPNRPPQYGSGEYQQPCDDVKVFFTRNGRKEGGWDLHEQLDERIEGGVKGLEGDFDLFPAVGIYGGVDCEVRFNPADWMYRP